MRKVAIFGKPKCGKCESAARKFAEGRVKGVLAWIKIERDQPWEWGSMVALEELKNGLGLSHAEAQEWAREALASWALLDSDLPMVVIDGFLDCENRVRIRGGGAPWAFAELKSVASAKS